MVRDNQEELMNRVAKGLLAEARAALDEGHQVSGT